MKTGILTALAVLGFVGYLATATAAHAGANVNVNVGIPIGVRAAPAPVVVAPQPVYVEEPPEMFSYPSPTSISHPV